MNPIFKRTNDQCCIDVWHIGLKRSLVLKAVRLAVHMVDKNY